MDRPSTEEPPSYRRAIVAAGVAVAVLLVASVLALAGGARGSAASIRHPVGAALRPVLVPAPSTTTTTLDPADIPVPVAASTTVARLSADTPRSTGPGGPPVGTVPATWYGYPSVLPVVATAPGWLEVRTAQRPNGSTAWIPASSAALSTTSYYLVLNLRTEHLQVYDGGNLISSYPAGIGTSSDPTPTGAFFVAMTVPPPGPGYGPLVLATSAHSDAISDWEGLGDAIIAIHGPITSYDDSLIGSTGARISHGCIRLHDADLARLGVIPAGTPLEILG